jgi:hypothetical protein
VQSFVSLVSQSDFGNAKITERRVAHAVHPPSSPIINIAACPFAAPKFISSGAVRVASLVLIVQRVRLRIAS